MWDHDCNSARHMSFVIEHVDLKKISWMLLLSTIGNLCQVCWVLRLYLADAPRLNVCFENYFWKYTCVFFSKFTRHLRSVFRSVMRYVRVWAIWKWQIATITETSTYEYLLPRRQVYPPHAQFREVIFRCQNQKSLAARHGPVWSNSK